MRFAFAVVLSLVVAGTAHAVFPGRNGKIGYVPKCGYIGYHLIDSDGTGDVPLSTDTDLVRWSADGEKTVFQLRSKQKIAVGDASTDNATTLPVTAVDPSFSPDGTQIVYYFGNGVGVHVVDADGSNDHQILAAFPNGGADAVFGVHWSPKGDKIAVWVGDLVSGVVATVSPTGTGYARLFERTDTPTPLSITSTPDWSPDGQNLYFSADESPEPGTTLHGIYRVSASGGVPVKIIDDGVGPAVSPDGTSIVYVKARTTLDPVGLMLSPIGGGAGVPVGDATNPCNKPTWQVLPGARLGASLVATPVTVTLDATNPPTVSLIATLENIGAQPLTAVAPKAPPVVVGAADLVSGPTPPTIDLGIGEQKTISWVYRPTNAGTLTFRVGFAGTAASGPVENDDGILESIPVDVKEEKGFITVTVAPSAVTSDSSATSQTIVKIKVVDSEGKPAANKRVRLKLPQYSGGGLDPHVLVCASDGTRVFPPGENATALIAQQATTPASGEITYELWVGTELPTTPTRLLVTAEAIDDDDTVESSDSEYVDVTSTAGGPPTPSLTNGLDAAQTAQLPEAQRLDAAGITGRGTPREVLASLVRWLEVEREDGRPELQSIDFVPITSADGKNAGVLFYTRGDSVAVAAHLEGSGGVPANAFVLQIEISQLDALGRYEVQWVRPLMALGQWESSRPLNRLGGEDPASPVRGPAIAATDVATSDPYTFLGYPYPSAGSYGGGCVPRLAGVGVAVHSPVNLLWSDSSGGHLGIDATGALVADIPGAIMVPGEPAYTLLPAGTYRADVTGTGRGKAIIVVDGDGGGGVVTFKAKPGKTGTLDVGNSIAATFQKRRVKVASGVSIRLTGLKRKLKVADDTVLALGVVDVFGQPVAGARVHVVGRDIDAATLTGQDGAASVPLGALTKATRSLTVEVSGRGLASVTKRVRTRRAR
jgi:hypothetical protein